MKPFAHSGWHQMRSSHVKLSSSYDASLSTTHEYSAKGMPLRLHPKGGSPDQASITKPSSQLDSERWAIVCHDSMQALEAKREAASTAQPGTAAPTLASLKDDMDMDNPTEAPATLMGYALTVPRTPTSNVRNALRRAKLVDWQLDVCADPDPADVFQAGVAFFDSFMTSHQAAYDHDSTRAQLQKYAAACIALGCKVEDVDYMATAHLAELCMDTYTVDDLQAAELEVALELRFDLQSVTPAHYLDVYALVSGCGDSIRITETAEAMLDAYQLHWELLGLPRLTSCLLASAALYLARRLEGAEPFHHPDVIRLSRHDDEHVEPVAAMLAQATVAAFSHDRLQAITRRYAGASWRSRLRVLASML